ITDALALVGLGTAILANLRGNLADDLLVDAVDHDLGRLRHGNRHAFGGLIDHVVAEAKSKLQVLALHSGTVADAGDLEPALEAVLHAGHDVLDLRARHAPLGAGVLALVTRLDGDLAIVQLDQNLVVDDELELALRALGGNGLAVDAGGDALRNSDRFLSNTRHVAALVLLVLQSAGPIRRSGRALRRRHSARAPDGPPSRPWASTGSRCRGRWRPTG